MSTRCVTQKSRKIGISAVTDSLTPRRFMMMSATSTATSIGSLSPLKCVRPGMQKIASPPAAIETVMVRT